MRLIFILYYIGINTKKKKKLIRLFINYFSVFFNCNKIYAKSCDITKITRNPCSWLIVTSKNMHKSQMSNT